MEAPRAYFPTFFHAFACTRTDDARKLLMCENHSFSCVFRRFSAHRTCCAQVKKRHNIAPGACRTELSTKIVLQTRLGACRALFGKGLGQFGMPLGRLLAGFWLLLGGFGILLGAPWLRLGRFRASFGSSPTPFERILSSHDTLGLDFGRFGGMPGQVLEGLGGMFWHAFRCASHFMT